MKLIDVLNHYSIASMLRFDVLTSNRLSECQFKYILAYIRGTRRRKLY
jgi:hypothetical protein